MNIEMNLPGSSIPSATHSIVVKDTPPKKGWRKILDWLNDLRGNISMAASIIATMSFQLATNPPGGVVQPSDDVDVRAVCSLNKRLNRPCPGESVLAAINPDRYVRFMASNTICFVASLSVCLLLVSGFPLNHRFSIWLLSIGMCITITSLALTYLYGMLLVTPSTAGLAAKDIFAWVLTIWIGLLVVVGFLLLIRLFGWYVDDCIKKPNRQQQQREFN